MLRSLISRAALASFFLTTNPVFATTTTCAPQIDTSKFSVQKDVAYMQFDGQPQYFDFYKPVNVSNPPLIVLIHGGAWAKGSKDTVKLVDTAQRLVMLGFAVANFNYPIWDYHGGSTHYGFPAGASSMRCGTRYLMANAGSLKFDYTRISFMGTSAGANLAGIMAYAGANNSTLNSVPCASETAPIPRAKSVILYYPPTYLLDSKIPMDLPNAQNPHGTTPVAFDTVQWVVRYLNDDVARYGRQASILPYVNPRSYGVDFDKNIETLIVHGDRDQDVDIRQSKLLNEQLSELSMFKTFVVEKGETHGFDPFRVPSSCDLVTFLNRFAR